MTQKRTFGFNPSSMATTNPTVDTGVYAGTISGAQITNKDGTKKFVRLEKDQVWNETTKKFDEVDNYVIKGDLFFGVTLTSKKAIKALNRDEPKVFGQVRLAFDMEQYNEDGTENPNYLQMVGAKNTAFTNWIVGAGLGKKTEEESLESEMLMQIQEGLDFDVVEDMTQVPEELQGVDDVLSKLTAVNYWRAFLTQVCELANGQNCLANVKKQNNKSGQPENVIDCNYGRLAGIIPYKEGAEFDLDVK
jgi:hypothetical protein